jgi:hypothetical protein
MNSHRPEPHPAWTIDQLVEALNQMRDAWTRAALELRDIQFDLDTAQRREAMDHAHDIVKKLK